MLLLVNERRSIVLYLRRLAVDVGELNRVFELVLFVWIQIDDLTMERFPVELDEVVINDVRGHIPIWQMGVDGDLPVARRYHLEFRVIEGEIRIGILLLSREVAIFDCYGEIRVRIGVDVDRPFLLILDVLETHIREIGRVFVDGVSAHKDPDVFSIADDGG